MRFGFRRRGTADNTAASPLTEAEARQAQRRAEWERVHRRRLIARALLLAGAVVAVTHWLTHLRVFQVLPSMTAQDIAIGYPTAALLALAGGVLYPADKT